jgi:hypothetical protein
MSGHVLLGGEEAAALEARAEQREEARGDIAAAGLTRLGRRRQVDGLAEEIESQVLDPGIVLTLGPDTRR